MQPAHGLGLLIHGFQDLTRDGNLGRRSPAGAMDDFEQLRRIEGGLLSDEGETFLKLADLLFQLPDIDLRLCFHGVLSLLRCNGNIVPLLGAVFNRSFGPGRNYNRRGFLQTGKLEGTRQRRQE